MIKYSFMFVVLLIAGVYFFQGPLLNLGFQKARPIIIDVANKSGITISELDAQELALDGTDTITFGSFVTKITLPNKKVLNLSLQETKAQYKFDIDNFSLKGNQFKIEISNPSNEKDKPLIFKGSKLRLDTTVNRANPQESIQQKEKNFN